MSEEETLLAFDVSTPVGSVAVARGGRVLVQELMAEPRAHASGLVPGIASVLRSAGVERRELDGIVVGLGPGSFTGVRVAAATARGLSHGLGIPVWGVSSLAAAALSAGVEGIPIPPGAPTDLTPVAKDDARPRCVLFDARSDRVYAGCYRVRDGRLSATMDPVAWVLDEVLRAVDEEAVFCGDAALRHAASIRAAGRVVAPPPLGVPTAAGVLRGRALTADPPLSPRWSPDYLRDPSVARAKTTSHGG